MYHLLALISDTFVETWHLFMDAAVYILFGIIIAGLLRMFLSPHYISRHLGEGRIMSVIKASLMGIPVPLCSCGVLPAAASIKKQGANNGATTAFLISTPESGVDSIAISYALLDPIMTVVRPLVAFLTAFVAGITENMINPPKRFRGNNSTLNCTVDNCCDGEDCLPEEHSNHHGFLERAVAGMRYAFGELWEDLVGWFLVGLVLAGVIAALVPEELLGAALGGGFGAMILMLVIGVPLYICATASTPIAAALILKGVSPGAALVFLLVGPATNIASMSVLVGLLGKRATAVYLAAIASVSVAAGLVLDLIYRNIGIDAGAVMGQAGGIVPGWLQILGAAILIGVSIRPLAGIIGRWWRKLHSLRARAPVAESCCSDGCG